MSEPKTLPKPTAEEVAHSEALAFEIVKMMDENGGSIPFSRFFNEALYHPKWGYYTSGIPIFGAEGDFVTAPLISPYFSFALANQCAEILPHLNNPKILELGAGDGTMARDLLLRLEKIDQLPDEYWIIEVSPQLRERQAQRIKAALPQYFDSVKWLEHPPEEAWEGIIVGNEVLDALAVERFTIHEGEPHYIDVTLERNEEEKSFRFVSTLRKGDARLIQFIEEQREAGRTFPEGYQSEFCATLNEWLPKQYEHLKRGALFFIDYGYEEAEYYRPERNSGTLLAHFKHHAHENFYLYPGIQDLTANVNFTQVAEIALNDGLEFMGYTTQNFFLLGNQLTEMLEEAHASIESDIEWFKISKATQELVSPEGMGERFKVIAFGREIDHLFEEDLQGFSLATYEYLL